MIEDERRAAMAAGLGRGSRTANSGLYPKLNVAKQMRVQPLDLSSAGDHRAAGLSLFFAHLGLDRTAELLSLYQDP